MAASSGDHHLIADALGRKAVAASSGMETGCVFIKTLGVCRSGDIADSCIAGFHIADNFIHSGNDDNMFGSMDQTGNTVTVTVNVDQFTVHGNGVCTHEIIIGKNGFYIKLPALRALP